MTNTPPDFPPRAIKSLAETIHETIDDLVFESPDLPLEFGPWDDDADENTIAQAQEEWYDRRYAALMDALVDFITNPNEKARHRA